MPATFKLDIRRPSREPTEFEVEAGIYTVGSDADCGICLSHPEVEARHAILTIRPGGFWVEDLDSPRGTYVASRRIAGRHEVLPGQQVGIGPFLLLLTPVRGASAQTPDPAPRVEETPPPTPPASPPDEQPRDDTMPAAPEPSDIQPDDSALSPASRAQMERRRSIKQQIHRELVDRLDIKRLTATRVNHSELEERARATIKTIVREVAPRLPDDIHPDELTKEIFEEALALGPLEDFLADPEITEIMVNGPEQIFVEKNGRIVRTGKTFMDDASVLAIIERIVSPIGRRIDESQPYVDARLPDGSRVNAIIHPLSLVGPCLTIRKFAKVPFTDEDLIRFGTLPRPIAAFVNVCVKLRKNIVVSGGTGSGKTTLLNVFSGYLPHTDRIITIEDAAELRLEQIHVVRLEARPPNIEGKGAVAIRDLVRNALRMRPDRIVVGECRGGEALDMLQAMNTGHDGSLTTVHANSPRDVISRLETMVLMSGMDLPVRAIREQIASAIDLIVHESRFSDGTRKVTRVTEVVGQEGEQITMQDIFEYEQTGVDPEGKVLGRFRPTGAVPTFIEEIASRGLTIDRTMFDPSKWEAKE